MASAELSRRVGRVVGYTPLCEMSDLQRREFHEALLDADAFEDLPGKWQAAILKAEAARAASDRHPELATARLSVPDDLSKLGDSLVGIVGKPLARGQCPSQLFQSKATSLPPVAVSDRYSRST
jgi:hypothetical protein